MALFHICLLGGNIKIALKTKALHINNVMQKQGEKGREREKSLYYSGYISMYSIGNDQILFCCA